MKKFYLGVLFSDGSILEYENLRGFRQATSKRKEIISGDNGMAKYVVCTAIVPVKDSGRAKTHLRLEWFKLLEQHDAE